MRASSRKGKSEAGDTSDMWVVLLGPPGAGKGTQARALSARHGWLHLSSGDLLRDAVALRTPLGRETEGYIKQGSLVPDRIILDLMCERISASASIAGCLFDGFPRNLSQARELDLLLREEGGKLDRAIIIEVSENSIIRRLTSRRVCGQCNRVYNLLTNPSRTGDRCEDCGSELQQRPDDCEETIRHRLAVYIEDTEPLKDYYEHRGILGVVSGDASPFEVEARIEAILVKPTLQL